MAERCTAATISTRTMPFARDALAVKMEYALAAVERYEWRFIPEGSFWFEDSSGEEVLAPEDLAEIVAFG